MKTFIDQEEIETLLSKEGPDSKEINKILAKAKKLEGLNLFETSRLLLCKNKEDLKELYQTANYVKDQIYGKRVVLFAPLYVSNVCVNNCSYCSFRKDNKDEKRITLNLDQIKEEVIALQKEGHKRILLLTGEAENMGYLLKVIKTIYETKSKNGEIRRLNINIAPLDVESFKQLKTADIGTYQLFQETYHKETYDKVHLDGPKKDYLNRLYVMHRAQEAGINDVGIGVLFGLYDYKFEVLALLQHAEDLEKKYGSGPHTISVPRIESANAPLANNPPETITDEQFKKIISILRIAVPYTGIILSTRESAELRNELLNVGVSQMSAGSRTNPGGYTKEESLTQFSVHDTRPQKEVIRAMLKRGYIPSFCTSCYRLGRTGEDFMHLAKPGEIKDYCLPNALMTLKEYLIDYGDSELETLGDRAIEENLKFVSEAVQSITRKKLKLIEEGKRDVYL